MFNEYINRQDRRSDTLDAHRVRDMAAVLDLDFETLAPQGRLPPLGHWLYFNPWARQSELGLDGHPRRGGFMPPIALPRRMFAGGRVTYHQPLYLGEPAERLATITSIQQKTGASGELIFVTVRYEISGPRGVAIEEEQDIVFRGVPSPSARPGSEKPKVNTEPLPTEALRHPIKVDPVLLFRFSALTSNSHRIHYDHPYVTETESYPGLVVHGPLQAVLLVDLVREHFPSTTIARFSFQARKPLFEKDRFECVAIPREHSVELMTRDDQGASCMTGTAELRP